jgi:RcsF protein
MSFIPTTQKTLKIALMITVLTAILGGCSGNYTFNSNVKADSANEYFSASKVNIYQDEQSLVKPYRYLGLVEGEDCQLKAHLAVPDIVNARTQARQLAHKQDANGIIFTHCVDIETKHCVAQIVCYAKMYQVAEKHNDNQ